MNTLNEAMAQFRAGLAHEGEHEMAETARPQSLLRWLELRQPGWQQLSASEFSALVGEALEAALTPTPSEEE